MAPQLDTQPIHEHSHLGVLYGLICVALALLPWIFFDWDLHRRHDEYITTEVREALQSGGWLPLVMVFVTFGLLGVFLFHFLIQR